MEQAIPRMKRSIWDYLFYLCALILMIWLILKVTGVIQTPAWLEYGVPIGTAIVGFVTWFQSINDKIANTQTQIATIFVQLAHHDKDLEQLKADISMVKDDVSGIRNDVSFLKVNMDVVKRKLHL